MIKVTIELDSAIDGHVETLHTIYIGNDGSSHDKHIGNYNYYIMRKGAKAVTKGNVWKTGRVEGFRRLSKTDVELLGLVLQDAFGKKKQQESKNEKESN